MSPFPTTLFLLFLTAPLCSATLGVQYYDQRCPHAENIIYQTIRNASLYDPKVPARILRMFFHDCFIRVPSLSLCICVHNAIIDACIQVMEVETVLLMI